MGSSTTTQREDSSTTPWAPQAAALQTAFNGANDALGKAQGVQAPNDFVAQFTPDQLNVFRSMLGYGSNNAVPQSQANAGTALSSAGTDATTGALSGLSNYDPTKLNNTDSIVAAANKYADGQDINAQVRNAMLNATQTARDVTLPQIEQNAALTGNTNSSRTGIAQGLVQRGLAQQSADLGATLRNDAYKTGLGLASQNANANNSATLGALTGAASAGTGAVGTGINAGSSSINNQSGLYGLANAGATGEQQANQAALDNALARYQSGVSSPYDALRNYMGIVGSNNWGGHTTGTKETEKTPSAWEVIGGLMGAGANAAKTFSDRRLKTDIYQVGTLDNGLPVYRFRYQGLPQVHIGLMAQDVETAHPDAVTIHESGYKMVDYEKATA